jgi:hypothetical protein
VTRWRTVEVELLTEDLVGFSAEPKDCKRLGVRLGAPADALGFRVTARVDDPAQGVRLELAWEEPRS